MLNRKLGRDLWQQKIQFLSIFLMAFLGLMVFVGLDAEGNGIAHSAETFYEETNLADLWIKGVVFSESDIRDISAIPGVRQAERRLSTSGEAILENDTSVTSETDYPYMEICFLDTTQEISKLEVVAGEDYVPEASGVWIDYNFAAKQKLAVGDTLTLRINNKDITELIRGIVMSPEYVYYTSDAGEMIPSYGSYGYAYLSGTEYPLAGMESGNAIYTEVVVDIEKPQHAAAIKQQITVIIDSEDVIILDREQNNSYNTLDAEAKQHKMMGFMFPVVFLLIAILGIITTMTRMMANQRIQIGTLKALGFGKGRITRHYMSYGFWISSFGAITGGIAGCYLLPPLILDSMKQMYNLPNWNYAITGNSYIAVIAEILISTLVSFLACRRELQEQPALALKPKPPKKMKHSWLEKSKLWLHLSFSTQWNFRDVIRNKTRTFMGIVGVAGCTMLLLCAFGCQDSIKDMAVWMYEELTISKSKILLEATCTQRDAEEYAYKYAGQMIEEATIELYAGNIEKNGVLTVVDNGSYQRFQSADTKEVALQENGIAITYKMAQLLGVKEGSFVRWHIMGDDSWQNTRIMQIIRTPSGQGIVMNRDTFEQLEYSFCATGILTNMTLPSDLTDENQIQAVQNIPQLKKDMNDSMEMMNMMVGILIGAAVILGVVVLYNLGVLSFVEKTREIATLKVLGFQTRRIRNILQTQNIWITTAGILVGMPLGYLFLVALCDSMSDSQDLYPVITFASYVFSIVGTFAVSILVNFLLSGKVKTINMVDALKGVE